MHLMTPFLNIEHRGCAEQRSPRAKEAGLRRGRALTLILGLALLGAEGCATSAAHASPAITTDSNAALRLAQDLGSAFANVSEKVAPAVVSIRTETQTQNTPSILDFFRAPGREGNGIARGNGSGVVIRADGFILTNNHVVAGATRIDVIFESGNQRSATVVGTDEATDLAVIKVNAPTLPFLEFGDSSAARVGEWVLAIGSPFGLDYTVTAGVLSATGRGGIGANEIEDYLQTDASINPGNSGGPLVNLRGEILGINTMIVGRGSGIGFAVPSNIAAIVATQLIEQGVVRRPWIGVGFQELTPELAQAFGLKSTSGALVSGVVEGGPAAAAKIKPGDVITSVNATPISDGRDLLRRVLMVSVGETLTVGIIREGRSMSLRLKTTERPGQRARTPVADPSETPRPGGHRGAASLGLELEALTPILARRLGVPMTDGVIVSRVAPGSPAERAGLRAGDLIVEADRRAVTDPNEVERAFANGEALLRVERKEGAFYAVLKTTEGE